MVTITDLQEDIRQNAEPVPHVDEIDLGEGCKIVTHGQALHLLSEAESGKFALIGQVEDWPSGQRWVIWRKWYIELTAVFGKLPAQLVMDGDA